ncbi:hypothetical protein [Lentzea nigeriaca]|uniref:hypothetical protein n=1 Tax=Lentzea nigeriaca TaxID=1128665 RepID=UPI00195C6A4D|nr:hypothetical protein [Lentzea nigeriaca]MBM7864235.1 putative membrane protein YeiB [Lentzea nigeriaca]
MGSPGHLGTDSPLWLLTSSPHSGTTFAIVGDVGVAIMMPAADRAGAVVFALVCSRFFRRGPLEFLLHKATTPANRIS